METRIVSDVSDRSEAKGAFLPCQYTLLAYTLCQKSSVGDILRKYRFGSRGNEIVDLLGSWYLTLELKNSDDQFQII